MKDKIPRRYRQDIHSLNEANLLEGERISMSLQEFGRYCERDQLKIAAYEGLAKYLHKQYGITLCLTSRKTKGNPLDEGKGEEQTY